MNHKVCDGLLGRFLVSLRNSKTTCSTVPGENVPLCGSVRRHSFPSSDAIEDATMVPGFGSRGHERSLSHS